MLNRLFGMLMGKRARRNVDARNVGSLASRREQAAFLELNRVAPLAGESKRASVEAARPDAAEASPPARTILCREALLGQDKRVAGYFLKVGAKVNARVCASSVSVQRLVDQVLVRSLQAADIQRLLAHRLAFVEVSASSLGMPYLEAPQPQGIVYIVGANPQLAADLASGLTRLRERGFQTGLRADAVENASSMPFLEWADFLLIDIGNSDIPVIRDQVDAALRRAPAIRLVATNIQTLEEYSVCAGLPFSYYQGAFITSREKLDTQKMDAGRLKILQLLNRLRGDAETSELTALIRQNLTLSYKLLRYINSPGVGLTHKVATLEQALMVLGRLKFYRWLTLMLFITGDMPGLNQAVMENAMIRARLAELCSQHALSADEREEVFVAGMFSLLDVMLAMPMEAVLKQVSLPSVVVDALIKQDGKYAPYLELAIACEQSDNEKLAELAQAVGLEAGQVNGFHQVAMLWAQQIGE